MHLKNWINQSSKAPPPEKSGLRQTYSTSGRQCSWRGTLREHPGKASVIKLSLEANGCVLKLMMIPLNQVWWAGNYQGWEEMFPWPHQQWVVQDNVRLNLREKKTFGRELLESQGGFFVGFLVGFLFFWSQLSLTKTCEEVLSTANEKCHFWLKYSRMDCRVLSNFLQNLASCTYAWALKNRNWNKARKMSTARHEALKSEDYIELLKSVEVFKGRVLLYLNLHNFRN